MQTVVAILKLSKSICHLLGPSTLSVFLHSQSLKNMTKQAGSSRSTSDLFLRGAQFKSLPETSRGFPQPLQVKPKLVP